MRRAWLGALVVGAAWILWPAAALGAEGAGCARTAHVTWRSDWESVTVEAASVRVPGCGDGHQVGLQLLTPAGEVPAEPLKDAVTNEAAYFNLEQLDVGIEVVEGVRVFIDGTVLGAFEITVDLRYFNAAGKEQIGRRSTATIQVQPGASYEVADPPRRYHVAECTGFGTLDGVVTIGEGPGVFTASSSGLHVACFQHDASEQVEGPAILGVSGTAPGQGSDPSDLVLPFTGTRVGLEVLPLAGGMLLAGAGLVWASKRRATKRVIDR